MIESYLHHVPVIHPTAWVHPSAVIIGQVVIGPEVSIWPGVVLRGDDGDIIIGARSNIQDGTIIHATDGRSRTVIGECVTVGHRVILHGCTVGDRCLVGMGSCLLDNAVLEADCMLGACSLLTQNKIIPSGSMAFGNPARVTRSLTDSERTWIAYSWQRYLYNAECYRTGAAPACPPPAP